MEQLLNKITISHIDSSINKILSSISPEAKNVPYVMHFTQGEEYFIETATELFVPHLPIHHDIKVKEPTSIYLETIKSVIKQLTELLPECFSGLTYFFDPAENLKPCFFRLYKAGEDIYLYLLRIDLFPVPFATTTVELGTNDSTPSYNTRKIFMESEILPLNKVIWDRGIVKAFDIKQIISQTWIGESGKGYLVHGVWMDSDLSKFFTKLFIPQNKRIYPFFPLFCKYKTICATVPILTPEGRKAAMPALHRAINVVTPEINEIQNELKSVKFSEALPFYIKLRNRIPDSWRKAFENYSIEAYLNENEQKEYKLHYDESKEN